MSQPSPQQQIEFLYNLQRLLNEGSFVATYKFALLSSLADLCVEKGEDTDAELELFTREIAQRFVTIYWRQSRPFLPKGRVGAAIILRQNTGREAGVIRLLREQLERAPPEVTCESPCECTNTIFAMNKKVHREPITLPLSIDEKIDGRYQRAPEFPWLRLRLGRARGSGASSTDFEGAPRSPPKTGQPVDFVGQCGAKSRCQEIGAIHRKQCAI
jgi:hypothetical protein